MGQGYAIERRRFQDVEPPEKVVFHRGRDRHLMPASKVPLVKAQPLEKSLSGASAGSDVAEPTEKVAIVRPRKRVDEEHGANARLGVQNLVGGHSNRSRGRIEHESKDLLTGAPQGEFVLGDRVMAQYDNHGTPERALDLHAIRTDGSGDVDVVVHPIVVERPRVSKPVERVTVDVCDSSGHNAVAGWPAGPAEGCRRVNDQGIVGLEAAPKHLDTPAMSTDISKAEATSPAWS